MDSRERNLFVGTDIGGTFTDLVGFDAKSGKLFFGKSLTTYGDLVDGILDCIQSEKIDLADVHVLKHGTTQVINTLLERKGARTALVTTAGFADIIEIGRASRPRAFQLDYAREPALISPELRFELPERVHADGAVAKTPSPDELHALLRRLVDADVQAVAVAFLNAYRNPANEQAVAAYLREHLPHAYVSCSTELSREWFEYERFATACANAYVGPRAATYIDKLESRLSERGFDGRFFMMASNGGVLAPTRARTQPLALVESGPIGGCIGAAAYARELGVDRLIAFDMGGTTAKCALVEDCRFDVQALYDVGGYDTGFPVRVPVLDIVEVGTGGGSIAQVDAQGRLSVGPKSAGSEPGPACFGRGGTEPTITDANLVLDRISSGSFMRGALRLDRNAATRAIAEKVAGPLRYRGAGDIDIVASGILSLAGANMASAIKEITVERGRDARDYTLFVFGGGGPLHGVEVARSLGLPQVIVPPEPGNFSALGMLFSDARIEETRTVLLPLVEATTATLDAACAEMELSIGESLLREVDAASTAFERAVEMRFAGQRHAMRIPMQETDSVAALRERFLVAYRARYGYADGKAPLEIVGLRLVGVAIPPKPDLARIYEFASHGSTAPRETREVFHAQVQRRLPTPVHDRRSLPEGTRLDGPLVIEEFGSTTVIGPGDSLLVGRLGELRIAVAPTARAALAADAVDPITAGIVAQSLAAVPNVIDKNITRTAFSLLVSVYKDFAVGIVAADGRLMTQSKGGLPVFAANALSVAVKDGLALYGKAALQAGDVIITNTAATMGQHLNNVVMYTPIRVGERDEDLIGFMVVVMHWMDVGGYAVGSCTTSVTTDVFQEGVQYPSLKLHRRGERAEDIYRLIAANTRFPQLVIGDVEAQVAGCLMGRDMVLDLIGKFGPPLVLASVDRFWDQSERAVRAIIEATPDGRYEAESFLDDDGVDKTKSLPIKVVVTITGDSMSVDLSGLAPEVRTGPWNAGYHGGAVAAVRIAAKLFFGTDEPANDGAFRAIEIICPEGTFMSASATAPIAGSGHNLPTVVDTILAAMGKAAPQRVPAAHHGTYGSQSMVARTLDGKGWMQHMESSAGGWGAAHDRDGNGPFRSVAHGDTPEVPIEVQETWGLYRLEHMKLRIDSGGAGLHRGGLGVERLYTVLRPITYSVMIERTKCPPWGVMEGKDGAPGRVDVYRGGALLISLRKDDFMLEPGDQVVFMSAGGGGYGDPQRRPVDAVKLDVLHGRVSTAAALADYGVDIVDGVASRSTLRTA